jgi:hypothetical protein
VATPPKQNSVTRILKYNRLTLVACLFFGQILAATYNPYEDSKVTSEQWQEYYDTVQSEFGETREEVTDAMLVLFEDTSSSTYFAFTLPEHPAHPAWITRKLVERDGDVSMEQIGYFAGDEEPFSELFQDYAELAYQIQSELERPEKTE